MPSFLVKDGYQNPEDRPVQDYAWQMYSEAYNRLCLMRPIPFTEIKAYHETFEVPYPLGVFVDAMRILEIDEINDRSSQ